MASGQYFDNPEIQRYFDTLSPSVQRRVIQSDRGVYTVDDLRILADEIMKSDAPKRG